MFLAILCEACARSEVGPSRLPVTEEIAGSNPVGRAIENISILLAIGIFSISSFLTRLFEPRFRILS